MNNRTTLGPITSGAKVLTGTRAVITGQARNLVNNTKHVVNGIKNHTKKLNDFEIDIDTDHDSDPDTEVTVHKKELLLPVKIFNRNKIKNKATTIIKESMYESPYSMGQGASEVRNVVNPYNPKRKSTSIVDQRDRFKTVNDIYPKVKVDNSIMDKRVRKVRAYVYRENGLPVASKLEHMPKKPFVPIA